MRNFIEGECHPGFVQRLPYQIPSCRRDMRVFFAEYLSKISVLAAAFDIGRRVVVKNSP
jgi:hypothetical protein